MKIQDIIVAGCGVIGLTSGIRLLEKGFNVSIIARDLPPNTTSDVAAAVWYPYKAQPEDKVLQWGEVTLDTLYHLAKTPFSGVSLIELIDLFADPVTDLWWKEAVRRLRRAAPNELPQGYRDGFIIEVPLMETPVYTNYLMTRFQELRGKIKQQAFTSLAPLYKENRLIINCTGLGARELVDDKELYPIRGQVVTVQAPNFGRGFVDISGPNALAYAVRRRNDCVLGGTAEENDWSLDIRPKTAEEILQKCKLLDPRLNHSEILSHKVGLRPGRKEVRLEIEHISETCAIIHNYGHGGSGFTLSWGCADEVVRLANNLQSEQN